ncbi:MAG: hypothetical protein FJZ16_01735 [Candidatus Omnitrophica bacterium]|nr:hypothetical protein [Candidatus Omnitrophota bacterium]
MKFCKVCGRQFVPNKYKPSQNVCNDIACQKERQRQNIRTWRLKNPDYFKYTTGDDPAYIESVRQKQLLWRRAHKLRLKEYRAKYREKIRDYMREYMKKYRLKKKNISPEGNLTKKGEENAEKGLPNSQDSGNSS